MVCPGTRRWQHPDGAGEGAAGPRPRGDGADLGAQLPAGSAVRRLRDAAAPAGGARRHCRASAAVVPEPRLVRGAPGGHLLVLGRRRRAGRSVVPAACRRGLGLLLGGDRRAARRGAPPVGEAGAAARPGPLAGVGPAERLRPGRARHPRRGPDDPAVVSGQLPSRVGAGGDLPGHAAHPHRAGGPAGPGAGGLQLGGRERLPPGRLRSGAGRGAGVRREGDGDVRRQLRLRAGPGRRDPGRRVAAGQSSRLPAGAARVRCRRGAVAAAGRRLRRGQRAVSGPPTGHADGPAVRLGRRAAGVPVRRPGLRQHDPQQDPGGPGLRRPGGHGGRRGRGRPGPPGAGRVGLPARPGRGPGGGLRASLPAPRRAPSGGRCRRPVFYVGQLSEAAAVRRLADTLARLAGRPVVAAA